MPDWVISALISLSGLAGTAAAIGIAWGTLNERVNNLKAEVEKKASTESMQHLREDIGEIKAMIAQLLKRGDA